MDITKFASCEHPGFKSVSGELRRRVKKIRKEGQAGPQQYAHMPTDAATDSEWA